MPGWTALASMTAALPSKRERFFCLWFLVELFLTQNAWEHGGCAERLSVRCSFLCSGCSPPASAGPPLASLRLSARAWGRQGVSYHNGQFYIMIKRILYC